MGRVQPYIPNLNAPPSPMVVGATPSLLTKRRYDMERINQQIITQGVLGLWVPMMNAQPVGQGAQFPVFPNVTPSSVVGMPGASGSSGGPRNPNVIKPVIMTTFNLMSPFHHSTPDSTQVPVPAVMPTKTMGAQSYAMPNKYSRRGMPGGKKGSGAYTIPYPPAVPVYTAFDAVNRMPR